MREGTPCEGTPARQPASERAARFPPTGGQGRPPALNAYKITPIPAHQRIERQASHRQQALNSYGESWMLDSLEGICPGQAGLEYPATSVPFSIRIRGGRARARCSAGEDPGMPAVARRPAAQRERTGSRHSAGTTRSSSTAPTPPVWPASRCISSWSATATGTFEASSVACRSGSRQGIRWKGRWWTLRATHPGPEQPRRTARPPRQHPIARSLEPGQDWGWWVVEQVAFVLRYPPLRRTPQHDPNRRCQRAA
jgi:hypothetical protein